MKATDGLIQRLAVIAFFPALVSAIAFGSTATLTWSDCLNLVKKQNAETAQAEQSLSATVFTKDASRSPFLPQLSGTLGYENNGGSGAFFNNGGGSSYTGSLLLTQNLFNGFADVSRVKQNEAAVDVSKAGLHSVKSKVSQELKSSFQGLRYAQDAVKLAEQIIDRRKQNLHLVQLRFEDGRENKGSLLLSEAYLKDAELGRLQADDAVLTASSQLAQVLGMDTTEPLSVTGEVPTKEPPAHPDFVKMAQETSEHETAVAQENQNEAGVRVAEGPFFPSLNLTGQEGWTAPQFPLTNNYWSVGVNFTIPLFSGMKDYYTVKSARSTYTAASYNRSQVDRQVLANLKRTYAGYLEAVKLDEVNESYAVAARVRAEIARAQYNNGLLSFEEWDIIENDLINREKAALSSRRDRVVSEAAWEQAAGLGVME